MDTHAGSESSRGGSPEADENLSGFMNMPLDVLYEVRSFARLLTKLAGISTDFQLLVPERHSKSWTDKSQFQTHA